MISHLAHKPSIGLGLRFALHEPLRLAAAIAGVTVAVLVMFVELGLLEDILQSQSRIATLVKGDLVVMSASRVSLHDWARFDRIRLAQLSAFPGVAEVIPIYEGGMLLENPPDEAQRRIIGFAFPAGTLPIAIGDAATIARALKIPDTVLFDRLSRPLYGDVAVGQSIRLDGKRYTVRGTVELGPDIVNDGAMVMSEDTWLANDPRAQPIMGVIRLTPGADLMAARRAMATALAPDTILLTPDEAAQRERQFTLRSAPIGLIFGVGVAAGLLIGVVICYQILFNEIMDKAKEYATLRAMGFADSTIGAIIFEFAFVLVISGFFFGLITALAADHILAVKTGMGVTLGIRSGLLVALPAAAIGLLAPALAIRHLAAVEPFDLF